MNKKDLHAWDVVEISKWPHYVQSGEIIINENTVNLWQDRPRPPRVESNKLTRQSVQRDSGNDGQEEHTSDASKTPADNLVNPSLLFSKEANIVGDVSVLRPLQDHRDCWSGVAICPQILK